MITIKEDRLESPEVLGLIAVHLQNMKSNSPLESVHALDVSKLKTDDVTFYTLWIGENLAGCGALRELDSEHGEIKSMRTHKDFLRKGVGYKILKHIIEQGAKRDYSRLSLETGTSESFYPAHKLYSKFGFEECRPFAAYTEDANSLFMTLEIV